MLLPAEKMKLVLTVITFHAALLVCVTNSQRPNTYRTLDGSGNNPFNKNWGAGDRPFRRILDADYCRAGVPRCQDNSSPLPSARAVSHTFLQRPGKGGRDVPDSRTLTHLYMAMGQFIAHDAGLSKPASKQTVESCAAQRTYRPASASSPSECFHIKVESNDPVYKQDTHPILKFVRDKREDDEQINLQTSWFDLSLVYGSTQDLHNRLRENSTSPQLKLRPPPNARHSCVHKGILPRCPDGSCEFDAGDPRVPEQIQLGAIHTIFVREHNRIVDGLSKVHPNWSVKRLFEEARKINIAQFQHIVYNEYLPILLGSELPAGATLRPDGFSTDYDARRDGTTSNVFMTATFRFGHTQIQSTLQLANKEYRRIREIPFNEIFFNTTLILEGKLDLVIFGAILQDAEKSDGLFNRIITSKFKVKNGEILGEDLVALDIQRARDHGIPGYNDWRRHCNLSPVAFRGKFKKFENVYKGVADDIDLFVGAMLERPVRGGLVGETFACLLAEDFEALRVGDRFWYERSHMFTKAQLKEIRKASLAKVLCQNLDEDETEMKMPKRPMEQTRPRERLPCEDIEAVDLSKF